MKAVSAALAIVTTTVAASRIPAAPAAATVQDVIDAAGRFLVPGFVDTNVHVSLYGGGRRTGRRPPSTTGWRAPSSRSRLHDASMLPARPVMFRR